MYLFDHRASYTFTLKLICIYTYQHLNSEQLLKPKKRAMVQKRELPVGSCPETGGQKYEGSKHSIWAHVIGQHHLPPVSGRTPTGTSQISLLWSAPTRFWPHLLHFVALHQSIRSDQPGVKEYTCLLYTSPSPRD